MGLFRQPFARQAVVAAGMNRPHCGEISSADPVTPRHGPLRWIALVLCGGLLSGLLASLSPLAPAARAQEPAQAQPEELRGVWLTANDMPVLRDRGRMQAAVNQLAELGFNRLYPVVWNSAPTVSKVVRSV